MIREDARVMRVEEEGPFRRVTLHAPQIACRIAPGQLLLPDLGRVVREPVFPAWIAEEEIELLLKPDHPILADAQGTTLSLMGPGGNGYRFPESVRRLLLVASADRLPVLLPLAPESQSMRVSLLLSAPTADAIYPVRLLSPAWEIHLVTDDGSIGERGDVRALFPDLVGWADSICIAHDPALYTSLADIVREIRIRPRDGFAQALVAPPMACGVGVCGGCAVPSNRGTKRACTDGPVFDLLALR